MPAHAANERRARSRRHMSCLLTRPRHTEKLSPIMVTRGRTACLRPVARLATPGARSMQAGVIDQGLPGQADGLPNGPPATVELSVVMPCLNEADTLATCIEKAQRAVREAGIAAEIIIADNGSTDGSQDIARRLGARVVPVAARGYGNALMGGIAAARGKYVLMGDADDSYDFLEIPKFVARIREGYDLVQGCRLPSGGGTVKPGAMPFLHRWLGNPMFSLMVRRMFWAPIHDVYCGMRAFTKEW